jgi:ankyrin repeat protein
MLTIGTEEPLAVAAVAAIHSGDVAGLRQLLQQHPDLAAARLGGDPDGRGDGGMTRTLLHVVTDWPGHYPNGAAVVALLVESGADVNARFTGPHTETPLHWAASNDDVAVLDALLNAGADIEARGAVIAGGTPLDDAVAFAQWRAARRLLERGAVTTMWLAAALGLRSRVEEYFAADVPPPGEVSSALWAACHGDQQEVAEYLVDRGGELNWVAPWDGSTPLDAARRSGANALVAWLYHRGARSSAECGSG